MNIELYVQSIKSHPDSNNSKRKEYTVIASALSIHEAVDISTDANPRHQKMTTSVTKGIKESLLSNDGLFRYKNQGITINCESVHLENDPAKPIVITLSEDPEDQNGIINGGHSYRAIKEVCKDIEDSGKSVEEVLSNQSVLIRLFSGIQERESIVSIAEGQNSSVSVTKEAFIHMNKGFDEFINKLPAVWKDEIQFKQNEVKDDGRTPFAMDSRDLLGIIWATNSTKFPSGSVDKLLTRPYSSKSSLVTHFDKDEGRIDFLITKEKLKNLLFIRDYIICNAERVYNENGGRFGNLRISEKFSESSVVNKYYEQKPNNTLSRGALLPIISSYRVFEEKEMFDFATMKDAWDDHGYKLINGINELVEVRESITEVGKDSISWSQIAAIWYEWLGRNQ